MSSRSTRREFLGHAARASAGLAAAAALSRCAATPAAPPHAERVIVVRFGGGVRLTDVFGPREQCLAPGLRKMAREGTLYTEMWNDGLTRHDAATRYLLTGRSGGRVTSNDEAEHHLAELDGYPTVFEGFRKGLGAPARKVLAAGVPENSDSEAFGPDYRAVTFASERGIATDAPSGDTSLGPVAFRAHANQRFARIVQDLANSPPPGADEARLRFITDAVKRDFESQPAHDPELAEVSIATFADRVAADRPYVLPEDADGWLFDLSLAAFDRLRPDLTMIGAVTPDLAHSGAWRTYAAAVRALDLQLVRLKRFIDADPYYRDRTTMFVTTDCGRGDPRFDEHLVPFDDPHHRRVFFLALGYGVRADRWIEDRRAQIDVAPTIARLMGFELPGAEGTPLPEITG